LEIVGQMPWSSNGTFLVDVLPSEASAQEQASDPKTAWKQPGKLSHREPAKLSDQKPAKPSNQKPAKPSDQKPAKPSNQKPAKPSRQDAAPFPIQAIYKPTRGERPLWDFPEGLHLREQACFALSETLGWHLVPPTVIRDGPLGEGSLQLFVLADFSEHYLTLKDEPDHALDFKRLCAFDVLANSTDRKSGHVLLGENEVLGSQIFAIDNGLSFHTEFKLRTVVWDFMGQAIPAEILKDIATLLEQDQLSCLTGLLTQAEIQAAQARAEILLDRGVFPIDASGHRWPWPII